MTEDLVQHRGPRPADAIGRAAVPKRRRFRHERRIWFLALMGGLPGVAGTIVLLWSGDYSAKTCWTLTLLIVGIWFGFVAALQHHVVFPLRTVSNMLAALREEDFSMRARSAGVDDALGEVLLEVNALGETLRTQRLGAMEATALLRKVIAEIDVAVFAFDDHQRLRLINQRGERLCLRASHQLSGASAEELGLAECLSGDTPRIVDMTLPGGSGRWELRRSTFREAGMPHHLLVLSDLTRALREEERQAWQRLIQVLRHEINNSLAPIDSLAQSLASLLARDPRPTDWETDVDEGLGIIQDRSRALNRFMTAYTRLTRLPKPRFREVELGAVVRRVAALDARVEVVVIGGPDVVLRADSDQLEQLLINLLRNGVDAAEETGGTVRVGWGTVAAPQPLVDVWVEDEGPGLASTQNLFVPFYTTKPGGSGIGLALSRQIAEAHGGRLTLENRADRTGCRACLRLPMP